LEGLAGKGRIGADAAREAANRITPIATLEEAGDATLAIEAIVESREAKQTLLRAVEAVTGPGCVLASNTSSLSITALANGLARPHSLVGMHFFNPVPRMRLVEVVSGLHTDPAIAAAVFALAEAWGKAPVHAASSPGFIVNRIARPFYAETLALLQERAAAPHVLDHCLRAAGFPMGPCALMDLIGHDTNFAVTRSVYEANFCDKRYVPSPVQRDLVEGGLLGRKSGQGFYHYPGGMPALDDGAPPAPAPATRVVVHGEDQFADDLANRLTACGQIFDRVPARDWSGLEIDGARLVLADGRTAQAMAADLGANDVAQCDWPLHAETENPPLAWAPAAQAGADWQAQAPAWLAQLGFRPQSLADTPGLVVARTIAMLVNEAADAVLHGVCTCEGADKAMKLGVNYPAGPFEWLAELGVARILSVLRGLDEEYRGERYRASPWLRRHAARPA